MDLSFPRGRSINDDISKELASITYASVDDAVGHILKLGRNSQLVKIDLKNAYRMVPVHLQDQHLLAITWEGRTYVDRVLPFGLRTPRKWLGSLAPLFCVLPQGPRDVVVSSAISRARIPSSVFGDPTKRKSSR